MSLNSLIESTKDDKYEEVDRILGQDRSLALGFDDRGWTAAHYAAALGNFRILRRLHDCNPQSLSLQTTQTGELPAHKAARFTESNVEVLCWMAQVAPSSLEALDWKDRSAIGMIAESDFRGSVHEAQAWLQRPPTKENMNKVRLQY